MCLNSIFLRFSFNFSKIVPSLNSYEYVSKYLVLYRECTFLFHFIPSTYSLALSLLYCVASKFYLFHNARDKYYISLDKSLAYIVYGHLLLNWLHMVPHKHNLYHWWSTNSNDIFFIAFTFLSLTFHMNSCFGI